MLEKIKIWLKELHSGGPTVPEGATADNTKPANPKPAAPAPAAPAPAPKVLSSPRLLQRVWWKIQLDDCKAISGTGYQFLSFVLYTYVDSAASFEFFML